MAIRPVFKVIDTKPYVSIIDIEFVYNNGFAITQKQKNIMAVHSKYKSIFSEGNILEISSKSMQPLGVNLSAFNLPLYVPSVKKNISVENAFQSGKVFEQGGPFRDILLLSPKEAKQDERLKTSGKLIKFSFEGTDYPINPPNAFYDYLYISALNQNENLSKELMEYNAFTDIKYNPKKSINCQAIAAARYVGMRLAGVADEALDNFDSFIKRAF